MQKKSFKRLLAAALLLLVLPVVALADNLPQTVKAGGMVFVPDHSLYFADVNEGYDWAYREIDYLANTGVVKGTDPYIYSPAGQLTRGDFVLMLYRAYDMNKYPGDEQFADVPAGAYYAEALASARKLGIATGDENNNFNPSGTLTRQDAMVLLKRTLDRTGLRFAAGDLSGFSDSTEISAYASESVAALVEAGVITGSNGKLSPRSAVTRAEMAVMLYRALNLDTTGETPVYTKRTDVVNLCIGSRIYPNVRIGNYDPSIGYEGLYELTELTVDEGVYTATLGAPQTMDHAIVWDGATLTVDGTPMAVSPEVEAIVVDIYSKRTEGLCSTGGEYQGGAVSVVNDVVETVYYRK